MCAIGGTGNGGGTMMMQAATNPDIRAALGKGPVGSSPNDSAAPAARAASKSATGRLSSVFTPGASKGRSTILTSGSDALESAELSKKTLLGQ